MLEQELVPHLYCNVTLLWSTTVMRRFIHVQLNPIVYHPENQMLPEDPSTRWCEGVDSWGQFLLSKMTILPSNLDSISPDVIGRSSTVFRVCAVCTFQSLPQEMRTGHKRPLWRGINRLGHRSLFIQYHNYTLFCGIFCRASAIRMTDVQSGNWCAIYMMSLWLVEARGAAGFEKMVGSR